MQALFEKKLNFFQNHLQQGRQKVLPGKNKKKSQKRACFFAGDMLEYFLQCRGIGIMRKCWNRQTGTFEVRVSMTCGFKSHLPHQTRAHGINWFRALFVLVSFSEATTPSSAGESKKDYIMKRPSGIMKVRSAN